MMRSVLWEGWWGQEVKERPPRSWDEMGKDTVMGVFSSAF